MFFTAVTWLLQINNIIALTAAIAISNEAKLVQPWKPLKRLSPI